MMHKIPSNITLIVDETIAQSRHLDAIMGNMIRFRKNEANLCLSVENQEENLFFHLSKFPGFVLKNIFSHTLTNDIAKYQGDNPSAYTAKLKKIEQLTGKPLHSMLLVNCDIPEDVASSLMKEHHVSIIELTGKSNTLEVNNTMRAGYATALRNAAKYKNHS
jgi:hypothetical protein